MKRTGIALVLAACAVAATASAQSSVLQVGGQGRQGPLLQRAAAFGCGQRYGDGAWAVAGSDEAQLPYATQQAMKTSPVTLYVSNNCGDLCADGRSLLQNRGIPYAERNAETNPDDTRSCARSSAPSGAAAHGGRSPGEGLQRGHVELDARQRRISSHQASRPAGPRPPEPTVDTSAAPK